MLRLDMATAQTELRWINVFGRRKWVKPELQASAELCTHEHVQQYRRECLIMFGIRLVFPPPLSFTLVCSTKSETCLSKMSFTCDTNYTPPPPETEWPQSPPLPLPLMTRPHERRQQ